MSILDQLLQQQAPDQEGGINPKIPMALSGIGTGLSQLGAGRQVDLSKHMAEINKPKSAVDAIMSDPKKRAILMKMPKAMAEKILMEAMFGISAPDPKGPNNQFIPGVGVVDMNSPPPELAAGQYTPPEDDKPNSYQEYALADPNPTPEGYRRWVMERAGKAGGLGVNMGTVPQGSVAILDPEHPSGFRYVPIGGSEAEADAAKAETASTSEAGARQTVTDVITSAAMRASSANKNRTLTGAAGAIASLNPANENAETYRQVDVLKSQSKVENLLAMKRASPTGASGFGQLSSSEGKALEARAGALDPASPHFERDLADYTRSVLRFVHGYDEGTKIFNESWVSKDDDPPDGQPDSQQGGVPDGVTQEEWGVMSPEDRALFQ